MNPSLISSKRFLVSDDDYQYLEGQINETEYLIEFQLADLENLPEFATSYDLAGLPNKGPAVDVGTFRMLNLITDGIVSMVIVLVSILLTAIAIISLRFTILSSMEDDVKEIGVMKAIGYAHQDIRNIYLIKYVSIAVVGCLAGYIGSLLLSDHFLANVQLYMGVSENSASPVFHSPGCFPPDPGRCYRILHDRGQQTQKDHRCLCPAQWHNSTGKNKEVPFLPAPVQPDEYQPLPRASRTSPRG